MFGCWQAVCLHCHEEEECRGVRKTHWCTKSLFLMAAQAFFLLHTHGETILSLDANDILLQITPGRRIHFNCGLESICL